MFSVAPTSVVSGTWTLNITMKNQILQVFFLYQNVEGERDRERERGEWNSEREEDRKNEVVDFFI